jgi:hypothetical protein
MTDIDDKIRFVVPIMLDDVSVRLGPWSGYHVLAQHPSTYLSMVKANFEANCGILPKRLLTDVLKF